MAKKKHGDAVQTEATAAVQSPETTPTAPPAHRYTITVGGEVAHSSDSLEEIEESLKKVKKEGFGQFTFTDHEEGTRAEFTLNYPAKNYSVRYYDTKQ